MTKPPTKPRPLTVRELASSVHLMSGDPANEYAVVLELDHPPAAAAVPVLSLSYDDERRLFILRSTTGR